MEEYIPYITGIIAVIIASVSLIISFSKLRQDKSVRIFDLMKTIDKSADESIEMLRQNNYEDTISGLSQYISNFGRLVFLYKNKLISKNVMDSYKTNIALALLYVDYFVRLFPHQKNILLEDNDLINYCKENNIEPAKPEFFRPQFSKIMEQREEFLKKTKNEKKDG